MRHGRRRGFDPVMIQHHHIQAQRLGFFQRRDGGGAAIHRDHQLGAFGLQARCMAAGDGP